MVHNEGGRSIPCGCSIGSPSTEVFAQLHRLKIAHNIASKSFTITFQSTLTQLRTILNVTASSTISWTITFQHDFTALYLHCMAQ